MIGDTGVHGFTSQAINIVREKLVEEKEKTQDSINHLGQLIVPLVPAPVHSGWGWPAADTNFENLGSVLLS